MAGFVRLTIFAGVLASPVHAQDFVSRDWTLGCNEAAYCIARADGTDGMELKIERPATADAPVFVSVRLAPETPLAEGMRVDIEVLGRDFSDSTVVERIYSGNEMTFGGAADRPLIDALRLGNKAQVSVRFGGTIGTKIYDVSLVGITGALAEMDREQGRDDHGDAIVLIGGSGGVGQSAAAARANAPAPAPAPKSAVAAQAEPLFGPALYGNIVYGESDLPDAVLMTGYRVFDCDFPSVIDAYGAQVVGVVQGLELWMVPCNPADVNVDYYISFHSDNETEFYEFKASPSSDERYGLVTNPRWDNEKRQLTVWSLYGPDSDCGSLATYQYISEDDAFDLIAYREKESCDGTQTLPEDYPLVWSAG